MKRHPFRPLLLALCLLMLGCQATRPAPYRFKPGPSYLPGPKPYVHERYPTHP